MQRQGPARPLRTHVARVTETLREDLDSRGHLFDHLRTYDTFLGRHVSVISDFTATKNHREDHPQYPYWFLREGFRNALIQRDYESIHGRISVSVYPTRFEIWSYGDLPPGLSIKSLKTRDRSLPVNPDIAQVLFLRGLVDLLWRGTRKMVEEFKSHGLPEPVCTLCDAPLREVSVSSVPGLFTRKEGKQARGAHQREESDILSITSCKEPLNGPVDSILIEVSAAENLRESSTL